MAITTGTSHALPLLLGLTTGAAAVALRDPSGSQRSLLAATAIGGAAASAVLVARGGASAPVVLGAMLLGGGLTAADMRMQRDAATAPSMILAPGPFDAGVASRDPKPVVRTLEYSARDASRTTVGPIPNHVAEPEARTWAT